MALHAAASASGWLGLLAAGSRLAGRAGPAAGRGLRALAGARGGGGAPPAAEAGTGPGRGPGGGIGAGAGRRPIFFNRGLAGEVFVRTQTTPNPSSLMFIPGQEVMDDGSLSVGSAAEARDSPLAKRLIRVSGVQGVFLGSDFITVTKGEGSDWAELKPQVFAAITDFYASGEPVVVPRDPTEEEEEDDEVVAMIKELLDTRIRPAVQDDGGDIEFKSFDLETGIVEVEMQGACAGCPSSSATLKGGVENMLMHYIPEVREVVQVDEEMTAGGKAEFSDFSGSLSI